MPWNLYGRQYDLLTFMEDHPGGKEILRLTENLDDITPLFESYHGIKNFRSIKSKLATYEMEKDNEKTPINRYTFELYHELCTRVKKYYAYTRMNYKASQDWLSKIIALSVIYMFMYYIAFFSIATNVLCRCMAALLAGVFHVTLCFCIIRDSSHYAISKMPGINIFLSRFMNSWNLWNYYLWFRDQANHHFFTGLKNKDPYMKLNMFSQWGYLWGPFTALLVPGQFIVERLSYVRDAIKNRSWYRDLVDIIKFTELWEGVLVLLVLQNFAYNFSLPVIITYIGAINITQYLLTVPNHDTYESAVINHIGSNNTIDWAKLQIQNSGNFSLDNNILEYFFGGINYHIEHHLFPTICHEHYPEISIIVQQFCKDYGIPYTNHESLWDAYKSHIKTLIKFKMPLGITN